MTLLSHTDEALPLMRGAPLGLSEQLAQRILERIRSHVYAAGARLPSVRTCAKAQAVSTATVVAAYEQLVAQGWVQAQPQKGFFVRADLGRLRSIGTHGSALSRAAVIRSEASGRPGVPATTDQAAYKARADLYTAPLPSVDSYEPSLAEHIQAPETPLPTHANALIRGMFRPGTKLSGIAQPSAGVLPAQWLANGFMASAVRHVAQAKPLAECSLEYGDPQGELVLRQALAQRLASFSIHCPPQQIITTLGASQALDMASRTLLRPGEPVMVEEPGWTVEFARLVASGFRVLPVPRGPNGPDSSAIERYCSAAAPHDRPKLFISISVLHNPTGASLSPSAAHQLLQLAHRHNFYVVEDDTYAHFAPDHTTRVAALDSALGLQRVIYVGGFAKALAPNWRVGFVAAPQAWVEPLTDTKMLMTLTTPALLERALARIIQQGHLRKHCDRLSTQLHAARGRSVKLALQTGCRFASEPAGVFGWVDVGCDTERLAERLLDSGYLIAPGSLFFVTRRPTSLMRMNFAATQSKPFWDALASARDSILD